MGYIFAIYSYYVALIAMEALMVDRDNSHRLIIDIVHHDGILK